MLQFLDFVCPISMESISVLNEVEMMKIWQRRISNFVSFN